MVRYRTFQLRWARGVAAGAAVFDPAEQQAQYDKDGSYVRKWGRRESDSAALVLGQQAEITKSGENHPRSEDEKPIQSLSNMEAAAQLSRGESNPASSKAKRWKKK